MGILLVNTEDNLLGSSTPKPPPILWHYTSIGALLSIVDSGHIWASHIRYLNDSSESERLWVGVIKHLKARLDSDIPSEDREKLSNLIQAAKSRPPANEFVASFSENCDDLSQWRAYCPTGSGVSIGFLSAAIRDDYPLWVSHVAVSGGQTPQWDRQMRGELFKVAYLSEENTSDLDALIRWHFELSKSLAGMKMPEGWPGPPYAEDKAFSSWILQAAAAFKHEAFRDEREWRLVLYPFRQPTPGLRFRAGKSNLIPYVEVELNWNGDSKPPNSYMIGEVIVGPTPNSDLSIEALKGLFASKGHEEVQVKGSTIPFRDW